MMTTMPMLASLSSPYALMAWVMVGMLILCFLFVVWIDDKESRQKGLCILAVGLVFGLFCLWVLDDMGVDAKDLFHDRAIWGMRDRSHNNTYEYMFFIWVTVSSLGGIGLYRTLVKLGILSSPEDEEEEE